MNHSKLVSNPKTDGHTMRLEYPSRNFRSERHKAQGAHNTVAENGNMLTRKAPDPQDVVLYTHQHQSSGNSNSTLVRFITCHVALPPYINLLSPKLIIAIIPCISSFKHKTDQHVLWEAKAGLFSTSSSTSAQCVQWVHPCTNMQCKRIQVT